MDMHECALATPTERRKVWKEREGGRERERIQKVYSVRPQPHLKGIISTTNLIMQCTHSFQFAGVEMLQINKAEAKPFVITFLIISSSPSAIYISYHLQILHSSRVFLLLNALYTNKAGFFRVCSFCVAKSNANLNSHGFLKYLGSINSYLKSSNVGQHRTN